MSQLQQLINQMCPNGVEWKSLVSVANVLYGCPFDAIYFCEDPQYIPLIRIRDVVPGFSTTYYSGEYSDEYIIKKGDILVGMDGNFNLAKWNSIDALLNQRVCKIESKDEHIVLNGFLYHYLEPKFKEIEKNTAAGSVKHLSAAVINKLHIPVPPLEIQNRIVEILDHFTNLTANLTAELALRRKQFEYYREKLLSLDGVPGVEWKTLDVCSNLITKQTGFDYTNTIKDALLREKKDNSIPYIQTKNFGGFHFDYNTDYYVPNETVARFPKIVLDKPCLLFSIVGASIGNVGYFPATEKCFLGGAICVLKPKDEYNLKYLYYYMASHNGQKLIFSKVKGSGQATVTIEDIRNFQIPLPPLAVQQSIVEKLDKFTTLIENIEKELDLRQKQYEYYREQLLTF